jgi:hypothetical protein
MGIDALIAAGAELFGGGAAEAGFGAAADAAVAGAAETGLASIPAIGDVAGTGAALAGGTTGLEGTLLAGGSGLGIGDLAAGTAGLGAAGTIADTLGGASGGAGASGLGASAGFGSAADAAASTASDTGLASGTNDIASLVPGGGPTPLGAATPPPTQPSTLGGVQSSNAAIPSNASYTAGQGNVFQTGSGTAYSPTAVPSSAGTSAAGTAGPQGIAGVPDPTAAGDFVGNTSVGGAPLSGQTGVTPAASGGSSTGVSDLLGKAGNSITSNPLQALGVAAGLGGLGYNIYQGQKQTANQNALTAAAQQQAATGQQAFNAGAPIATANASTGQQITAQGQALQQYLTTGQLPPNYQAQVDQAINSYKQQAISQAVAQGQPGDPNLNSSLAQTLAGIDQQRATLTANLANTLFSAGSADISAGGALSSSSAQSLLGAGQNASGLSAQLYQTLVQNDTTQAANTGKAIASLAAALNSKGSNTGTTATS